MSKEVYRFRVGVRKLENGQNAFQAVEFVKSNPHILLAPVKPGLFAISSIFLGFKVPEKPSHAAFLIGTDLFEYDSKGYHRRRGVGREDKFDWDEIGSKVNGQSYVTPDELELMIGNSKEWDGKHYNVLNHNCNDFVKWCLDHVGAGFFYKDYAHRYLV